MLHKQTPHRYRKETAKLPDVPLSNRKKWIESEIRLMKQIGRRQGVPPSLALHEKFRQASQFAIQFAAWAIHGRKSRS